MACSCPGGDLRVPENQLKLYLWDGPFLSASGELFFFFLSLENAALSS